MVMTAGPRPRLMRSRMARSVAVKLRAVTWAVTIVAVSPTPASVMTRRTPSSVTNAA